MAKLRKPALATTPEPTRPLTSLYIALFALLSAAATWLMRIEPGLVDIPVDFLAQAEGGIFANGLALRKTYTGFSAVDTTLSFLVASFIAGPAEWDASVRLQQIQFLLNFFPIVCLWNAEACRERNKGRLISYTALFACFYQTVGGAIIIPLYYLASAASSRNDTHLTSGRAIDLACARMLIPACVLGYLLPTVLMYVPWSSFETRQFWTAFWQPCPVFVNAVLLLRTRISSLAISSSPEDNSKRAKNADVKYLKLLYVIAAGVAATAHLGTLYLCLMSSNSELSVSSIFVPQFAFRAESMTAGLHYIFQVDYLGIFLPSLLWGFLAVHDVLRVLLGEDLRSWQMLLIAVSTLIVGALVGPRAALALIWWWREEKLIRIEQGFNGELKPKRA
ncbi:hypothetical protein F5Y15DRAFT_16069 [Xylariaceae sp. FL0016]|nr:hypothetical protein F5Y15DRAFT_16069 [Xylariaceae sp. FL0016]